MRDLAEVSVMFLSRLVEKSYPAQSQQTKGSSQHMSSTDMRVKHSLQETNSLPNLLALGDAMLREAWRLVQTLGSERSPTKLEVQTAGDRPGAACSAGVTPTAAFERGVWRSYPGAGCSQQGMTKVQAL